MSTHEDRLRDLLRQEAQTVLPAGDGLAKIQARIARRRRARFVLLPGAALASAGAATAFFLLGGSTPPSTLTVQHGGTPSATSEPTPTSSPSPVPTATAPTGPVLSAYSSADKDDVVRHWLTQAGIAAEPMAHACESCDLVPVGVAGTKVADATLVRDDSGSARVYRLASVDSEELKVTAPTAGAVVASPLTVRGTVPGVDENVRVTLRTTRDLATAGAPAGGEQPWSTALSWTDETWTSASLIAVTRSPRDGAINRVTAIPVTRGASAAPSFVGLAGGHVSLFDSTDGRLLRQLTYPPAGRVDTAATWAAGSLVWVRSQQTGCNDELDRLDGSKASTVVAAGTVHLGTPQLSPGGTRLAWLQTPCSGGSASVVVAGGGAPNRVLRVPDGSAAQVLDVTDDGTLLVHLGDVDGTDAGTIGVLSGGSQSFDGIVALAASGECYLAGGAAFDGQQPVAFETCGSSSRLVRWTATGARVSTGPMVAGMAVPRSTTVHSGSVLVWLSDGRTALYDSSLTVLSATPQSPDW